ncbi:MAG TPA: hypothetical protein PLL53_14865 [Saprospiraceae bacterium]|nr:hypothetical protein [Saprospiraceae bacterium]
MGRRRPTTATELPVGEKRHCLGGLEFNNDLPEAYNFGNGRVVFRVQYSNFA